MGFEGEVVLSRRADRTTTRRTGGTRDVIRKWSPHVDEFAREVRARRILMDAGLPVAEVLDYQPGPPSLLTLPFVDGVALRADSPGAALERLGALLARVHEVDVEADFSGNASWSGWMHGWLSHALTWWASTRFADACPAEALTADLDRLSRAMDRSCAGAILFDGRPDHFLVTPDASIAMIDVEELRRGDPAMDVAVIDVWLPEATSTIVRGYRDAGGAVDASFFERLTFYRTLRVLAAAEWHRDQLNDAATAERLLRELAERSTPTSRHGSHDDA